MSATDQGLYGALADYLAESSQAIRPSAKAVLQVDPAATAIHDLKHGI